jgi:hypothetical protein
VTNKEATKVRIRGTLMRAGGIGGLILMILIIYEDYAGRFITTDRRRRTKMMDTGVVEKKQCHGIL